MSKKSLPKVLIVGRTNVGKSTLFNRLSVDVKSITLDYHGVTRDFIKDTVEWQGRSFELIDTGGITLRKTIDAIEQKARQKVLDLIKEAELILFVVDGIVGLTTEDREIAKHLFKAAKKTVTVVNKSDSAAAQENIYEFERLGFKPVLPISAQHGKGIADLLETIVQRMPEQQKAHEQEASPCNVVILGKPNVGKSTLMNLLSKQERAIVADMPGTTREALTEPIKFYQENIMLSDTPGVRRKRAVNEDIEQLMVKSTMRALDDADVVLLMIDASSATISDQELKLAFYAFEKRYKSLVLLFNKDDIADEQSREDLAFNLDEYDYFLKKVPQLTISCKTGKNIGRIMPLVMKVWQRHSQRFSDEEITYLIKEALEHRPLYKSEVMLRVKNAKQIRTAPITFALTVNVPVYFHPNHFAFFERVLRKKHDLLGVPIRFVVQK